MITAAAGTDTTHVAWPYVYDLSGSWSGPKREGRCGQQECFSSFLPPLKHSVVLRGWCMTVHRVLMQKSEA